MEEGSYLLIDRGMAVRGTDGDLGTVEQVVADVNADIFRGILISAGILPPRQRFLTAEHVVSVANGAVHVDLSRREAEALPESAAADSSTTR
jgi:uncharacterized protein YrrD